MENKREITFLNLNSGIFIPGVGFGNLGDTFPSPTKTMKGFKMYYNPAELSVVLVTNGKEIVVPITAIKAMTLAPKQ